MATIGLLETTGEHPDGLRIDESRDELVAERIDMNHSAGG